MSTGEARRRPAASSELGMASNYKVAGRVTLNLMCDRDQAFSDAGQVESLPSGTLVILRVTGSPDPAVVDRLRVFGAHVRLEVDGRDGACTRAWVRALRDGVLWAS